jgi:hypothetical protein
MRKLVNALHALLIVQAVMQQEQINVQDVNPITISLLIILLLVEPELVYQSVLKNSLITPSQIYAKPAQLIV